jgi:hypothetical protein
MKKFVALASLLYLFIGCGPQKCKECEVTLRQAKDTVVVDDLAAALINDTATTPTGEQKEIHEKIVKKYGEQWDFCTCIVANDSITDAFEKNLTPAQEKKLLARWDYVDRKCKELTTFDNTTPEERARHEKRVNKCLKQNGLKK